MIPVQGDIYRHFKNKLYQIVAVATHSETGEKLVIYQALYGTFKVYARPLDMFVSEVDHEKYPQVTQKYRFEKVNVSELENAEMSEDTVQCAKEADSDTDTSKKAAENLTTMVSTLRTEDEVDKRLMEFLDADTYAKKLDVLTFYRNKMDDSLINAIAASLDTIVEEGNIDDRYDSLRNYVKTQAKFECNRFR